mmetsp:Transcript_54513/g.90375  ORF Transcript_54513/g.90375 Transcript_54513/m.90375 type:complete len:456 (+) Transcript_54513:19-1386(+)
MFRRLFRLLRRVHRLVRRQFHRKSQQQELQQRHLQVHQPMFQPVRRLSHQHQTRPMHQQHTQHLYQPLLRQPLHRHSLRQSLHRIRPMHRPLPRIAQHRLRSLPLVHQPRQQILQHWPLRAQPVRQRYRLQLPPVRQFPIIFSMASTTKDVVILACSRMAISSRWLIFYTLHITCIVSSTTALAATIFMSDINAAVIRIRFAMIRAVQCRLMPILFAGNTARMTNAKAFQFPVSLIWGSRIAFMETSSIIAASLNPILLVMVAESCYLLFRHLVLHHLQQRRPPQQRRQPLHVLQQHRLARRLPFYRRNHLLPIRQLYRHRHPQLRQQRNPPHHRRFRRLIYRPLIRHLNRRVTPPTILQRGRQLDQTKLVHQLVRLHLLLPGLLLLRPPIFHHSRPQMTLLLHPLMIRLCHPQSYQQRLPKAHRPLHLHNRRCFQQLYPPKHLLRTQHPRHRCR